MLCIHRVQFQKPFFYVEANKNFEINEWLNWLLLEANHIDSLVLSQGASCDLPTTLCTPQLVLLPSRLHGDKRDESKYDFIHQKAATDHN